MDGKSHPGDGQTRNPFGNGHGATMGPSSAGNDFRKNPQGNGQPSLGANDFQKNPGGKAAKTGPENPRQETSPKAEPDMPNRDGSPGELVPKVGPRAMPENPTGAGTIGNPRKPFRL